ncbi:transcription factor pcc1 [Pyrenophora seminiperda CCB06]|uniref:Transcription factor pcc1 n=1 Tax=Pyrenophora seminiperda CCB06 TaxID=1302712 RepID=A0A3M7M868_9PLEO|nr:transcription factor pcc1 [Pyrenophora seminiperda CCB06]
MTQQQQQQQQQQPISDWNTTDFPCTLTLDTPFPTTHLASTALRALSVDAELSPLVRRSFSLTNPNPPTSSSSPHDDESVLRVNYAATTNRMLRVAVNGFIESIGVVIGVMTELDMDVVYEATREGLQGVQGLEGGKVG